MSNNPDHAGIPVVCAQDLDLSLGYGGGGTGPRRHKEPGSQYDAKENGI